MSKKKSLQEILGKQGWTVQLKSDFYNSKPEQFKGVKTIEIDPPESKKPRLFIYDPEKIAVHVVAWQRPDRKDIAINLQKKQGWTLVHVIKNEEKGIFINKNIIPVLNSTNIQIPVCS